MYQPTSRGLPGPTPSTHLLSVGKRVQVSLIAPHPATPPGIVGTIQGIDAYGLLIERERGGSVFIPWSNVSIVEKLT